MRQLVIIGFVIAGLVLSAPAWAQTRIGVVDIQKIILESKAGKAALAEMRKEIDAKRAALMEKKKQVEALEAEIRKNQKTWKPATLAKKREVLAREAKGFQRMSADTEDELRKRDIDLRQKIMRDLQGVIRTYAAKEGYAIVEEKHTLLYSVDNVDITPQILKLFDRAAK